MSTAHSGPTGAVAATFESYEPGVRAALLDLRDLILETAEATDGVGPIDETLKWGQPSYLTAQTKSGSTIRVAPTRVDDAGDYAMYFICHTNLVDTFEAMFDDVFTYDANRALVFSVGQDIARDELRECIAMALTYHQR